MLPTIYQHTAYSLPHRQPSSLYESYIFPTSHSYTPIPALRALFSRGRSVSWVQLITSRSIFSNHYHRTLAWGHMVIQRCSATATCTGTVWNTQSESCYWHTQWDAVCYVLHTTGRPVRQETTEFTTVEGHNYYHYHRRRRRCCSVFAMVTVRPCFFLPVNPTNIIQLTWRESRSGKISQLSVCTRVPGNIHNHKYDATLSLCTRSRRGPLKWPGITSSWLADTTAGSFMKFPGTPRSLKFERKTQKEGPIIERKRLKGKEGRGFTRRLNFHIYGVRSMEEGARSSFSTPIQQHQPGLDGLKSNHSRRKIISGVQV